MKSRGNSPGSIRGKDGRDFPQSQAANGMSLHGKLPTLVVVEQQSLLSELLEQGLDLSVLGLDDVLLTLAHEAAETGQQQVPLLEESGHFDAEIGQYLVTTGEIRA